MPDFSNLFWNETLHVSDSSSVHHQEFFTAHTAMVYVIQVCLRAGSGRNVLILLASCQQTCMTYTIAVCTVKNSWWWTEELSETCRVSFENKFEKSVHVVGYIIRICHNARSHERKKVNVLLYGWTTLANILNKSHKSFHQYLRRGETIIHCSHNSVQTRIIQIT